MPLDGLTLRKLAEELNDQLADARVDRVNHPRRNDLFLHLRRAGQSHRLVLSVEASAPRVHLTPENPRNPERPSGFCTFLRKQLGGARVLRIDTKDDERILYLKFEKRNEMGDMEEKTLLAELMGRHSNLILINEEGLILGALKHVTEEVNRYREVLPGIPYILPPPQDKVLIDALVPLLETPEGFFAGQDFTDDKRAVNRLIVDRVQGVSPALAKELCFRANLHPGERASALSTLEWEHLDRVMLEVFQAILTGDIQPGLISEDPTGDNLLDFHIIPFLSAPYFLPQDSINETLETYYRQRLRRAGLEAKRESLSRRIQESYENVKKLIAIREADIASTEDREEDRARGEFILANLHLAKARQKELRGIDYYDPELREKVVPLDPRYSASDNAKRYFKRYEKAGNRRAESERRLAQEEQEKLYLETLMSHLDNAESKGEIEALKDEFNLFQKEHQRWIHEQRHGKGKAKDKRQQKKGDGGRRSAQERAQAMQNEEAMAKPREFISSDGYRILVGRNSRQNEKLTHKIARRDDLWFHRHLSVGTHVVVMRESKDEPVPESTILEAAGLCAWYSAPHNQGAIDRDRMEIAYCLARDVKRMPGGRPGLVIYENFKTILVEPLNPKHLTRVAEGSEDQD